MLRVEPLNGHVLQMDHVGNTYIYTTINEQGINLYAGSFYDPFLL